MITATIVTATDTDSHTGGEITQEDESIRVEIRQNDLDVSVKIKFGAYMLSILRSLCFLLKLFVDRQVRQPTCTVLYIYRYGL